MFAVRAEPIVSGISWTALTLEVGKSPTEVPPGRRLPVAPPSAISEFASSSSPSCPDPRTVQFSYDDGRQHGEQDQGARARPALGACATRPGHAVNMLAEERRCKRRPGAASMQLHGCARHCRQLCLTEPQSSHSNLACRLRQPAAQSPGEGRTCVSSYGVSWASSLKGMEFKFQLLEIL